MKIKGKKFGPRVEVVVIPRDGEDIVFQAAPVLEYDDFEALCPAPTPPMRLLPGGRQQTNVSSELYKKDLSDWSIRRGEWMVIQSLKATEGLEWETVVADRPTSWGNYLQEFKDSGFNESEIGSILDIVMKACGLNQTKVDEATARFLATREQARKSAGSPSSVPNITQSGALASVS